MQKSQIPKLNENNLKAVISFFDKNPPPDIPMRLNVCTVVNDPKKMVSTHIATCKTYYKSNKGNYRVGAYWERLITVGKITKSYYAKKKK
jgi:hypothetical protein